jgi:hypothetical protein
LLRIDGVFGDENSDAGVRVIDWVNASGRDQTQRAFRCVFLLGKIRKANAEARRARRQTRRKRMRIEIAA